MEGVLVDRQWFLLAWQRDNPREAFLMSDYVSLVGSQICQAFRRFYFEGWGTRRETLLIF